MLLGISIVAGGFTVLISLLLASSFWIAKGSLPSNRLTVYKTRIEPSVFSNKEIEEAIELFENKWIERHPEDKKKLRNLLNSLVIYWRPRRWSITKEVNGTATTFIASAEILSRHSIAIWIGPKLVSGKRRLGYTQLISALVQIALFHLKGQQEPALDNYQDFIKQANKELINRSINENRHS